MKTKIGLDLKFFFLVENVIIKLSVNWNYRQTGEQNLNFNQSDKFCFKSNNDSIELRIPKERI